jgi:hypothetical protein
VRLFERPALQLRGVHAARAFQQVVRFVHEHGDAPAGVLHGGEEEGAAVEVVVVVAHDHVAPVGHFLREEIGAHRVLQRDLPQRLPVEPAGLCGFCPGGGQAVVEALGERAGIAVAGAVGVLADLLARREFEHARLRAIRCTAFAQHPQRIERHRAAGGLGGEEEDLVQLARRAGLEERKDGGQRLADARGRLRHEAAPAGGGAVDGFGQFALAGAKGLVRERELRQRPVERAVVVGFLLRPRGVAIAQRLEVLAQRVPRVAFFEHGFLAGGQVQVDERDRHLRMPVLLAQHPAVGTGLRPVQRAVVAADGVEVAAEGLDFFHAGFAGLVAIGAAANAQRAVPGFERHLALVAAAPPPLHERMAGHAFERAGRGHEAQVEVARLRAEGAKRLDGNDVRSGGRIWRRWRKPGPSLESLYETTV